MTTDLERTETFEEAPPERRRWAGVGIGLLVVAVTVGLLARTEAPESPELVVSEPPTAPVTEADAETTVGPSTVSGVWEPLPDADTPPRTRHSMVWTGEEVLVYGGQPDPGDDVGLRYDPVGQEWSRMSPSPIGSRTGHTTVWTGEEMLVFEGAPIGRLAAEVTQDLDGAAYDPDTDTWRKLSRAPVNPRSGHTAVWTGEEMLVFGGSRTFETNAPVARYDPDDDEWSLSSPSPLDRAFGLIAGVWTGQEAVFWTGSGPQDVAAYDPDGDTWRLLPPSPAGMRSVSAAWTGEEMVLLGVPELSGAAFGGMALHVADERWTFLPPSPQAFAATHVSQWTGESVVMLGGPADTPGVVWTPGEVSWARLPPAEAPAWSQPALSGHAAVWTGEQLILWGGQGTDGAVSTGVAFMFSEGGLAD